jgi:DNA-binding MarR family transcriptional regulator
VPSAERLLYAAGLLGVQPLSPRMLRMLREGHQAAGYESPSHGRMALAVALAGRGHSVQFLEQALKAPGNALGETFRRRDPRWQGRELGRLWDAALARVRGGWAQPAITGRPDALLRVRRWHHALSFAPWQGKGGATDLAVAEAAARIAFACGGPDFTAGRMTLAVAAGVSESTAGRSLTRLTGRRWLRLIEAPTPNSAGRYRLTMPLGADRRVPDSEVPELGCGPVDPTTGLPAVAVHGAPEADLGADAARWAALGKSTMRVLRALASGPATVRELADRLLLTPNAVRIQLHKLARLDAAVREEGSWRRGPATLEEIEERFGVSGRRERQAAAHAEVRRARAEIRERWRAAYREVRDAVLKGRTGPLPEVEALVGPERLREWRARITRREPAAA